MRGSRGAAAGGGQYGAAITSLSQSYVRKLDQWLTRETQGGCITRTTVYVIEINYTKKKYPYIYNVSSERTAVTVEC